MSLPKALKDIDKYCEPIFHDAVYEITAAQKDQILKALKDGRSDLIGVEWDVHQGVICQMEEAIAILEDEE